MKRRTILKQAGAIAGSSALLGQGITVVQAGSNDRLTRSKGIFGELSFQIVESADPVPQVSLCRNFPQHTVGRENKNKVFLNKTGEQPVDVSNQAKIAATHSGLKSGDGNSLSFDVTPVRGDETGIRTIVPESSSQRVDVDRFDDESLRLSIEGAEVDVASGESASDTFDTEIRYRRDGERRSTRATVEISATHRGKVKFVGHPDHMVFEKNDLWKAALRKGTDGNGVTDSAAKATIVEHDRSVEFIPPRRGR